MKNLLKLTILTLFLFGGNKSMAQSIEIKTGLNLKTMYFNNAGGTYSDDFELGTGFHFGVTKEFPFTETFSFEPGLLFSSKGYKIDIEDWTLWQSGQYIDRYENAKLNYIDIPVSLKLRTAIKKVQLFGIFGPYMAIGFSGKVSRKEYSPDGQGGVIYEGIIDSKNEMGEDEQWKRFDYGLQAGAGIILNKVSFRINYGYGLANIAQYEDATNKNRVLGISFGYIIN